jgi:hypothetical protein
MAIQKKTLQQQQTGAGNTGEVSRPAGGGKGNVVQENFDEQTADPNAAVFAALADAKEFSAPDVGTYEAILHEMKVLPLGPRGQSIQATFILASFDDEGELYGQVFSRFFKVFEADGRTPNSGSMMFWAAMMSKLGYPKTNRGQEAFNEINDTQPAVSVKVSENSNPTFPPNLSVVMRLGEDNENIVALREWIETAPF